MTRGKTYRGGGSNSLDRQNSNGIESIVSEMNILLRGSLVENFTNRPIRTVLSLPFAMTGNRLQESAFALRSTTGLFEEVPQFNHLILVGNSLVVMGSKRAFHAVKRNLQLVL